MEIFSYVMVLASVIAGLAITQLLQCVAGMIHHPKDHKA
jgi:xanthine/uracil permease